MMIGTTEHYDLLQMFEKTYSNERLDREVNKDSWKRGNVYQSGETNKLYRAYISGYSYGKCLANSTESDLADLRKELEATKETITGLLGLDRANDSELADLRAKLDANKLCGQCPELVDAKDGRIEAMREAGDLRAKLAAETARADVLQADIAKVESVRDAAITKYKELNKSIMCEGMGPNGSIWDHAANLQKELDSARKQLQVSDNESLCESIGRIISHEYGMERELNVLQAKCDAAVKEYADWRDGKIGVEEYYVLREKYNALRVEHNKVLAKLDAAVADCAAKINAAYRTIDDAVRHYRLTQQEDEDGGGYPLVDALTPDGDTDISRGKAEIDLMIDYIQGEVNDAVKESSGTDLLARHAADLAKRDERIKRLSLPLSRMLALCRKYPPQYVYLNAELLAISNEFNIVCNDASAALKEADHEWM